MKVALNQIIVASALVMTAIVARAEPSVDNYAANAVLAAQYDAAIARLKARVAKVPSDESALLNLAIAYRHSGRTAEAVALYERVLALKDVDLATTKGTVISSHEVARRALATKFTSR